MVEDAAEHRCADLALSCPFLVVKEGALLYVGHIMDVYETSNVGSSKRVEAAGAEGGEERAEVGDEVTEDEVE